MTQRRPVDDFLADCEDVLDNWQGSNGAMHWTANPQTPKVPRFESDTQIQWMTEPFEVWEQVDGVRVRAPEPPQRRTPPAEFARLYALACIHNGKVAVLAHDPRDFAHYVGYHWRLDPRDRHLHHVGRFDNLRGVEFVGVVRTELFHEHYDWREIETTACLRVREPRPDEHPGWLTHDVTVLCDACPADHRNHPTSWIGDGRIGSGSHPHDAVMVHSIAGIEHDRLAVRAGARWVVDGNHGRLQVISP